MQTRRLKKIIRKYGLYLICCWTLIIALLALLTLYTSRQDTLKSAGDEARDYFCLNMYYRAWAARMGGVFVPMDKVSPNPYLAVTGRDITTTNGTKLTLVNPAYMTRMVFESILAESQDDPIISKITSSKPLNPKNAADAWELQSLKAFEHGDYKERSEVVAIGGKPYLRLISQFVTEKPCLKCHAVQGHHEGDIRGAITISVPLAKRYRLQASNERGIIGGYLLLWALGSSGIAASSRRREIYEETILANERKFRAVCDWTQDWEYWVSPEGVMNYVSPSCVDMTGYDQTDFIADPELTIRIVHPDWRAHFVNHRLATISVPDSGSQTLEFPIVTRNGETRWLQHLCRPVFDGDTYLGRRVSNRDATARKESEEKVSRLSAIVESSGDAIISKTLEGTITSWNHGAEKLFGYTEHEMIGKSMLALIPPERRQEEQDILATIAQGRSIENFETVRLCRDGSQVDVSETISPVRDPNGTIIGISKIARDITSRIRAAEERARFEQQLLHTQKLESLGVLAGGIAHDFNNILMAIIGNADLALMRINKESPGIENLRKIEQAAAQAADLAKQMLAYSGKGRFLVEKVNLNLLLEEMLHMLEVSISKKALLRLNLAPNIPLVEVDATQIRQVVMNLVINASEAIGDKSGVIAITSGCMDCDANYLNNVWMIDNIKEGLYVYLEVADSGCGMDKETLAKIFDPFFTTKFTGRGLGMAAVIGIVRGHKGAIKVYSELGKGTTIKILLPASDKSAEIFNHENVLNNWQGSGTVLLVDDEETVRGVGREMLRELGFSVLTAIDGKDALEIFKTHPEIALVILDLTMPHMDGEQCFRELRMLRPNVKVIMSSGYNEQEVAQKFVGKGLAGFIQKPYKLSTLKSALMVLD